MNAAKDLHPAQLASLLHFYADAGVEWLLEEEAIDRIAEMDTLRAAQAGGRRQATPPIERTEAAETPDRAAAPRSAPSQAQPRSTRSTASVAPPVSMPDGQAVSDAEFAAASARSLEELKAAMQAFNGCNLKNSARGLVFADGNPKPDV
ncbi:uracil-DNA glycosylase, partial [Rhizobium sp. TRM95111]|nr:uracil-DNA glycosylase [Rhizobium alarense]